MKKSLPWILVAAFAVWIVSSLVPKKEAGFHTRDFAKLPVVLEGRHQPWDSVARNTLLQLRGKQSLYFELKAPDGRPVLLSKDQLPKRKRLLVALGMESYLRASTNMTAVQWALEAMLNPAVADTRPVFRIDHPDLKGLLGLPIEEKNFAWKQIVPKWPDIVSVATNAAARDASLRTPYETSTLRLANAGKLYHQLKNTLQAEQSEDFIGDLLAFLQNLDAGRTAVMNRQAGKDYDEAAFNELLGQLEKFDLIQRASLPLVVPPRDPNDPDEHWKNLGDQLIGAFRGERLHECVTYYAAMGAAYRSGDTNKFNKAVDDYAALLAKSYPTDASKGIRELAFNAFEPFYKASVIYVAAMLLGLAFWVTWAPWTRRAAFGLIGLALVIHTGGLVFRMVLEGRPPVTNLYSSAIFIGWGACILGMVLERFYKDGVGIVVASTIGFVTLVIAHNLSLGGDTMIMLRAVLDTNFWLATHVVIVTLGYASTFVAGFLALIFVFRGFFTSGLGEVARKNLSRMVYAILCFATLFSFVGTVLGGIWADQSWGRFWGWDPKENGALMIVLWNAMILHARWGGMVKERGIMNLAIAGNIVTAWSWFGTNMLGIGLHAYGFTDSGFKWLMIFNVSQLLFIVIGLLPLRLWTSYQKSSIHPGNPAPSPAATGIA
jgi:ABC-type transport system involved in cytochrome c biogenesis permease subunit